MALKCNCEIFGSSQRSPYSKTESMRSPKLSLRDKLSIAQKFGKSSGFVRKTSARIHLNVQVQSQNQDPLPSSKRQQQESPTLSSNTTLRNSAEKLNSVCQPSPRNLISPPRFTSPQSHFRLPRAKMLAQLSSPIYSLAEAKQLPAPTVSQFKMGQPKPSVLPKNIHSLETTAHNLTTSIPDPAIRVLPPKEPWSGHKRYHTIDIPASEAPQQKQITERSEKQPTSPRVSIPEEPSLPSSRIFETVSVLSRVEDNSIKDNSFVELNKLCPKDTISTRDNFEKESFMSNNFSQVIYRSNGRDLGLDDQ